MPMRLRAKPGSPIPPQGDIMGGFPFRADQGLAARWTADGFSLSQRIES
jgi:hypothetical protein